MRWSVPYAVEAVVFFACACQFMYTSVQYQFIYQVVSEELNFTKNHSVEYCAPNTTSDADEHAVADEVSRWTLYSMMTESVTAAIGCTLFTSWSDSIGRKRAIAFPVVGISIAAVLQCVAVTYRLPLYVLIIVQVILGSSGTYSALLGIGSAYLSDIVKPEDRARRYNFLEISASLGGGLVQIGAGYWINSSGFVPTSIFVAGCGFIAILLIPFMKSTNGNVEEFSETRPLLNDDTPEVKFSADKEENKSQVSRLHTLRKQLLKSWTLYTRRKCVCKECLKDFNAETKHCEKAWKERTWRLWCYAVACALYICSVAGVSLFITMFLVSYPVCFTPILLGAQWGLSMVLIIFVPLSLVLLQGFLKLDGQTIIIIGILSRISSCSLMSIATGPILVFAATSFSVIHSLTMAFVRSEVSRLVSPKEQGAALAVMYGMVNLACIFSPLIFLTIYPATLYIFHGFLLLIAAMVYAVTLVLMTIVWIANKRTEGSAK